MEIRAVACHEWELRNQFRFSIFPFSFSLFLPVGGIKRSRKQFTHPNDFGFAFQIRQNYRNVAAKLPDQLAARATRRCELIRVRNYGDGVKAALSFADGFEDGDAFSTNGEAIRRVFHVATAENSARGGAKRGAHSEIGVRRMRVFSRLSRGR